VVQSPEDQTGLLFVYYITNLTSTSAPVFKFGLQK